MELSLNQINGLEYFPLRLYICVWEGSYTFKVLKIIKMLNVKKLVGTGSFYLCNYGLTLNTDRAYFMLILFCLSLHFLVKVYAANCRIC